MNTERQENENVVILNCEDLTSSIVTQDTVFGVIHKQLLDKLTEQIRESVLKEKQKREKKESDSFIEEFRRDDNFPLNYFITGKRGSGKTTFLRQVVKKFENDGYNGTDIKFLHWYDPSESFGVPADFFIEVTAAIKTKVEEFSADTKRYSSKYDDVLMFQHVMQKLDKAIVRFSQERESLSGLSEHRAAILRIDNPEMNKEIKRNFKKCMRLLCELYHVDAFVLVIDDIDIRTEQCYNVLENLRLFISNEYLVVLMAGDRIINIERVRERFFKEYDYKYHQCDEQGREERLSYIVSHAAQYFAKLFSVKQQFELGSLYTLSHKRNPVRIELKTDNDNQNPSLKDWLKELFHIAISINASEVKSYVDIFMSLPLRNIIQILEYWIREGMLDKLDQLNPEDSDAEKKRAGQNESEQTKQVREQIELLVRTALNHSLQDQLPDFSYSYEKLDSDDGEAYYALLLRLCQDTGDLEHGFYLSDKAARDSRYRYLSLVLAANFKRHIKDLKGFLSYFLYGAASVALYGKALGQFKSFKRKRDSGLKDLNDLRKRFEEYLCIDNWHSPSRRARHANMIWCYDYDYCRIHSGVLRICDQNQICLIQAFISGELQGKHYNENSLGEAISLLVSMNRSGDQDDSLYVSIYSYLAYIHRCVEICEQGCDFNGTVQRLRKKTLDYIPIKSCRYPEWQIKRNTKNGWFYCSSFVERPGEEKKDALGKYMEEIANWYGKMQKALKNETVIEENISPHVLGDIWSDFYQRVRIISHLAKTIASGTTLVNEDGSILTSCDPAKKGWKEFNDAIKYFKETFLSQKDMEKAKSMTEFYKAAINSFPLTRYLNFEGDFEKKTGNE